MPDSLPDLLHSRSHLLQEFSGLGDFQPGSVTTVTRRCGKPNCHCARPNDPGHGPHRQLTQKIAGKTVTQSLPSPAAVRKAEKEIAEFRRFQTLSHELVEVNQKICRLRPLATQDQSSEKKKRRPRPSSRKSPAK
jgi:hypothetical protein